MSTETARTYQQNRITTHDAKQWLERERNTRLVQLTAIEESEPDGSDQLMAAQTTAIRNVLEEITAAQHRLDEGVYGVCQTCSQPIPVERLEILPYARCCVGCLPR
ncbi:TraR/DksA family transcriptional regulator [Peterkaempfera bronchialis]|uniref:Molecular chaperone DnaK n=1 Tax=Peterkaempfera bronchialis TaxID=2126346 RepID=A0A345T010_9ACTN|nr:TraR/DksA C4-type zinc finger protein [Peterkaempfera bronchialis]AXI79315.1 molecular chaperone DnaK [Peterkaempfera bronchialis]